MIKGTEFKVYTFINCGRRVELPDEVDFYSVNGFINVVKSQLALERAKSGKRTKVRRTTLGHYTNVLGLIKKYNGTFSQWRRDLCTSVILIEVLFDDLNDMYSYGYVVNKFPNITSKYVYSTIFGGKCHISTNTSDYRYPKHMSKIMAEAAKNADSFEQKEFYYEISRFLDFIGTVEIEKIKLFKNRKGNLVVDTTFLLYREFLNFKKEMDNKFKA